MLTIANAKSGLGRICHRFRYHVQSSGLSCGLDDLSRSHRAGKIAAIILPLHFVAAGFEHSVTAALYSNGHFVRLTPALQHGEFAICRGNFFLKSDPSLGNIIGGALFIGAVYWMIYLKKQVGLSNFERKMRKVVSFHTKGNHMTS